MNPFEMEFIKNSLYNLEETWMFLEIWCFSVCQNSFYSH